jgi:hypothetical protein
MCMLGRRSGWTAALCLLALFGCADAESGPLGVAELESAWPNEPAGLPLLSDYGFGDSIPMSDGPVGDHWQVADQDATTFVDSRSDTAAPLSPGSVARWLYPDGMVGGSAPATIWYPLWIHDTLAKREVYAGFWWRFSDPWQGHSSNVNKIAFLFPYGGGDIYLAMYGSPGGPYHLRVEPQFPGLSNEWYLPNVNASEVVPGSWHRIEWYVRYASPAGGDGVVQWWLDGVLQGEYTDVETPTDLGFIEFKLSPTWGGAGDEKLQDDFAWVDHARLSGQ